MASNQPTTDQKNSQKEFKRLPSNIVPVHYDISLTPDLKNFTFEGHENITLKINKPTDQIVLNLNEIKILDSNSKITLVGENKTITIKKIEYTSENETVTLHLDESLTSGEAVLSLAFTGILNDKMKGFYRTKYVGPDGEIRWSATTQFEATDARRAFPCWDEPALKATFDITLVFKNNKKEIKALSNMPAIEDKVIGDERIVKFARTPIMSTYLVAFVVGEYDYVETKTSDGILVRVYTPIGKSEQGKFSLDVAARSLDFYRDYFNIPYPLIKLDMIAISDFTCGAMENWGLITYREASLLVDPVNTTTIRKQYVALTVAHELGHQWFGNLVTMEWWTHLWLNEGFATFVEFLCVGTLFPEFNIWDQFISDIFFHALSLDSLDNSHPIEVAVNNPAEVDEIFDDISYSKGAAVIRMLYNFIGDEVFRKGMNLYLTRHSYKNALTEDLWDALEEASNKPIRRLMSSWTKQKGYPVIKVEAKSDLDKSNIEIELSQEKFNVSGKLSSDDSKMLWSVPIAFTTSSSSQKPVLETLYETRTLKLTVPVSPDQWFKLNPGSIGVYRVNYSPDFLSRLVKGIDQHSIPNLDRLNLIDDLLSLVISGRQSSIELFRFIKGFHDETNYTVWTSLNIVLGKFNQILADQSYIENFQKFSRDLVNAKAFPAVGWDTKPGEPYLQTLLRALLISRLVTCNDPWTLEKCREEFANHVSKKSVIPADLRLSVYRAVCKNCDEKVYEDMMKLYSEATLQEEKNRIAGALGAISDPKFIDRVFKFSLSDAVRSQDMIFVIGSIAGNPKNRSAVWNFFKDNKDLFRSRYESGPLMARTVKMVTENFCTMEDAAEVEKFFKENSFPGTERTVLQSIETIKLNAALLKRDAENLKSFFH